MRKNLIKITMDEYRRHNAVHNWREAYKDQYCLYDRLMDRRAISRLSMRRTILDRLADRAQGFGTLSTEIALEAFQDNMRYIIQEIKNFEIRTVLTYSGFRYDRLVTLYLQVFHMYRYLKAHNVNVPKLPKQLKKDFAEKIRYAKDKGLMPIYPDACGMYVERLVGYIPTDDDMWIMKRKLGIES